MSLTITDIHIIHWGGRARRFGGSSGGHREALRARACLSHVQHFAALGCLRACSKAQPPLPFCSLQQQCVPRFKLSAQQDPHLTPSNSNFVAQMRYRSTNLYLNILILRRFSFLSPPPRNLLMCCRWNRMFLYVSRACNGLFILS